MLKKITVFSAIAGLLFSFVAVPAFAFASNKKDANSKVVKSNVTISHQVRGDSDDDNDRDDRRLATTTRPFNLNKVLDKKAWVVVQSSTNPSSCTITPPGHLIAPGYKKTHGGPVGPMTVACNTLPPGIQRILSGTTTPPVLDRTAPVISSVSATGIASTSASITWTTNEPATSKVYYGTTTPLSISSALNASDATRLLSHSMTIGGLTASTTYYFIVESKDAANNTATTTQGSFVTLP